MKAVGSLYFSLWRVNRANLKQMVRSAVLPGDSTRNFALEIRKCTLKVQRNIDGKFVAWKENQGWEDRQESTQPWVSLAPSVSAITSLYVKGVFLSFKIWNSASRKLKVRVNKFQKRRELFWSFGIQKMSNRYKERALWRREKAAKGQVARRPKQTTPLKIHKTSTDDQGKEICIREVSWFPWTIHQIPFFSFARIVWAWNRRNHLNCRRGAPKTEGTELRNEATQHVLGREWILPKGMQR